MLKNFRRDEAGSILVIVAISIGLLLAFIGVAIDVARAYTVQQHLQHTVDAATLAAAKVIGQPKQSAGQPDEEPIRVGKAYFWSNWRASYLGSRDVLVDVTFNENEGKATVVGRARLSPVIMQLFGGNDFNLSAKAIAQRQVTSLELALALDNTASMAYGAGSEINTIPPEARRRITLVKDAAGKMLDKLYGGRDVVPNMYLSVIPFTSLVNVGRDNTAFLKPGSLTGLKWAPPQIPTAPAEWRGRFSQNDSWRGCVFERGAGKRTGYNNSADYTGRDLTDDPPSVEPFLPYNVAPPRFNSYVKCEHEYTIPPSCGDTCSPSVDGQPPVCFYACSPGSTGGASHPISDFSSCRQISDITDSTTWCSIETGTFGQVCTDTTEDWSKCRPNYGPAHRCFGFDLPDGGETSANNTHYPLPATFWAGFPYTAPHNSAWYQEPGFLPFSPPYPTFDEAGMQVLVLNDDISSCGSGANINWPGGYFCETWKDDRDSTSGRWIPTWPDTANTPDQVKLGGWGNSGCGLPVLPLSSSRATVQAVINNMDVPLNETDQYAYPSVAYNGTIINQGLIWAWRTISPQWRSLWNGIQEATLPNDYTTPTETHNKAIVLLTDGLNYMQDIQNFGNHVRWKMSKLTGPSNNLDFIVDHKDYDSSAYGRLLDGWLYKNGSDSVISIGTPSPSDVSSKGEAYYQELMRRLLATCDNIRATKTKVFLIVFAVESNPVKADAIDKFNECVAPYGKYYDAITQEALDEAFDDIVSQLLQLRLIE